MAKPLGRDTWITIIGTLLGLTLGLWAVVFPSKAKIKYRLIGPDGHGQSLTITVPNRPGAWVSDDDGFVELPPDAPGLFVEIRDPSHDQSVAPILSTTLPEPEPSGIPRITVPMRRRNARSAVESGLPPAPAVR